MMKKLLLVATLMAGAAQATAAEKLYLFNWNDYIAEDTLKRFEQQCGCELVQEFYSGTEEMMAKLAAGASGYDVIIPTQNAVEALIRKGDLLELDKSRLANLSNEAAGYLDKDFDKGNRYSLPYAFTTTLVGYNKTELDKLGIDPADWSVIFDPAVLEKIKGRVTVMDDPQELFGAALKYLGHSANDTDPQHWKEAQALILAAKPYWAAFNSSSYIKELTLGNIWVAHGYSSDMYQARADAEAAGRAFKVDFALPRQGAVLAIDNMVIHKGSKNPDLAYRFIDFMLDGRNASELTNQIGTGTPNAAALPFIRPEIKTLAALFPDADTQARLEPLKDLNSRQRRALNKLWTEIKLR
ncbi:spermidine/putrescine ABC transporter substrate-binding protein [Pseudomonas aeruginosa]|uniref:polyamine ABC transporter substrate-binding protein n=1 Tax=Pseudomonas aeruginosa TaxID=287 RepID=UPI000937D2DD|nr:spermidine/putrescine ABC transporter substrate-binding protein [Pseudomonas aeruginosa]HBP0078804.1 spermidine/putrescine ABC transporter substrate-binding protein [Pseudomonas aeruginosa]HDY5315451.1 spermidine/putrescine ABC transporter substrate-binding protein [Pseudomonas aeruginosa]